MREMEKKQSTIAHKIKKLCSNKIFTETINGKMHCPIDKLFFPENDENVKKYIQSLGEDYEKCFDLNDGFTIVYSNDGSEITIRLECNGEKIYLINRDYNEKILQFAFVDPIAFISIQYNQ